ncbi:hypothetical protein Leryth_024665 [Lithospermum erythrorhizon]|nr:hypothetical protein Leryth_024665 [Lithospermum erythrorhizon]
MQDAIPYRRWATNQNNSSSSTSSTIYLKGPEGHDLKRIVEETPVLIFMKSGDCMGHVVKRLLQGLGVNPSVYEIDDKDEKQPKGNNGDRWRQDGEGCSFRWRLSVGSCLGDWIVLWLLILQGN